VYLVEGVAVIYLKSILAGAAASAATVTISVLLAFLVMTRFPELALRIFPAQNHDLQWGSFYYVNYPLWQIIILGTLAFGIGFGWRVRKRSAS
jgi:hypothetical protein